MIFELMVMPVNFIRSNSTNRFRLVVDHWFILKIVHGDMKGVSSHGLPCLSRIAPRLTVTFACGGGLTT